MSAYEYRRRLKLHNEMYSAYLHMECGLHEEGEVPYEVNAVFVRESDIAVME